VTHIEMPTFEPDPPQPPIPDDFKTEFPCAQCDRVFQSSAALNGHMIIHRDPIPCPDCGREFRTPGALGNHRKKTHGVVGPWSEKNAEKKAAKEADAVEVMRQVQERKDRKRQERERASSKTRINTEWQADDIFQSVVETLWSGGAIPVRCILPLMHWREATREFLEKVQSE
jgi:uncharacterized C2H2 Zn-finger protein